MACDERLASALRAALATAAGPDAKPDERRMFGGVAFFLGGNMVCGVYRDRAMFRVGKPAMAAALALPGVTRMAMGGRPTGGFAEASAADLARDGLLARLLGMALDFVAALPQK